MRGESTPLFPPRRVFAYLVLASAVGIAFTSAIGAGRAPTVYAASAIGIIGALCGVLAVTWTDHTTPVSYIVRLVTLATMGLLAAPIGWFFGPNSGLAATLALVLALTGLLTGNVHARFPKLGGWLVYVTIAAGQATVAALVLVDVLPDESVLRMEPPGMPTWHHGFAHLALQIVYLIAFLSGRGFQRRYRRLQSELDAAIQVAARHAALLEEARAEYQRALAVGRQGIFTGHTIGRFQLGELIGRGGAGEVYDARDLKDGTIAAVKLLRGERLGDAAEVARFIAAADAAMRVDNPHVVQARRAGGLEEAIPYLAMEKLEGVDLGRLIAERGRLDTHELRKLIDEACEGLGAVHAAGLAHGDVNPKNLILTDAGWKLIDFGATQRSGEARGTPRFIAPERISGGPAGASADLYGLAACVYAAVTGTEPLAEIPRRGLAHATLARAPLDPRLKSELTEDLSRALRIGLAKAPADRFADASALRTAFVEALDGKLADDLRARAAQLPAWSVAPPTVEWEPTDVVAAATPVPPGQEPAPITFEPPPPSTISAPSLEATRSIAWDIAFRDKLRRQRIGVLALCACSAAMFAVIIQNPITLRLAWIALGGVAIFTLVVRRSAATWPWAAAGLLSVGPAYALGLHSGVSAVIAFLLFAGGLFRTLKAGPWWSADRMILTSIILTHTVAYVLIATGTIPDGGNTPTKYAPWWTGPLIHLLIMSTYTAAFTSARTIDRRYNHLVRLQEVASHDAASKEALLATARAELDRALSGETGGLFTGSTIGGYTVEKLLGRGGMGEVYEARRGTERVALKVIRADRISNPDSLRRFGREASTLRKIDSPYVARVLELGTDERLPFLAMELVEGTSLTAMLREHERLDLESLRVMIRDVARGLEDVHRAGVLHRDIKPSNLVRTERDGARWKLVDFGIAKLVDAPSQTTGVLVMGTPAFMAPESIEGKAIDARSDLFSLCVVIYRALTGRPAWTSEEALVAGRSQPADPSLAQAPADLALALRIGLATSPADRFATGAELAAAFDAAFDARLDDNLRKRAHAIETREPWT